MQKEYWIERLNLQRHPEGGWFSEFWRSDEQLKLPMDRYHDNARNLGTSIYFMLAKEDRSALHRLQSDELWYFHAGGKIEIYIIDPTNGSLTIKQMSLEDELQVLLPRGTWFGAKVIEGNFVLVGCAVVPGFDFSDFELGEYQQLLATFPQHKAIVDLLNHP
jgi:predicted cupin superfamily sugar epimerase